jgi:hypothetical protein
MPKKMKTKTKVYKVNASSKVYTNVALNDFLLIFFII